MVDDDDQGGCDLPGCPIIENDGDGNIGGSQDGGSGEVGTGGTGGGAQEGNSNPISTVVPIIEPPTETSPSGIEFITELEGFIPNLYNDLPVNGNCTVGIGHLLHLSSCNYTDASEIPYISGITLDQAMELLDVDLQIAENGINSYVTVPLTQTQYDALASFVYNVGVGNFLESDLLTKLNLMDYSSVPSQMMRFTYSGSQYIDGLARRRGKEGRLFSEGIYGD
jgi:lysozyme